MKYRFLALFMACFYLFSSIAAFAAQTTGSDQEDTTIENTTEDSTSENDTTDTTDEETEDVTTEDDTEATSSTEAESSESPTEESTTGFSAIQTAADNGCIISSDKSSGLSLTGDGVILMEASSGAVLYSRNADTKFYPASITKILTTLVCLENGSLSDSIICNADTLNAIEQGSSRIGLEAGEVITLEDALYFVMLASGNDAAAVAAEHVGGTIENFVAMMNAKVQELGLTNTHFTNPHGLPDENHYTTARDMATIMQAAISNEDFCRIASATNYTAGATNLNEERPTWNHHKMILPASEYHYDGVQEGKTGYTTAALNTLVTTAERDGVKLIAVILHCQGASYTYTDTKKLFDYGFNNFTTLKPLKNFNLKEAAKEAGLSEEYMEKLTLYNAIYNADYSVFAPSDVTLDDITVTFSTDGPSDGVFGQLHVMYDGEEVGTLNVYYDSEIEYKIIANEDTDVSISAVARAPFILVGIMAVLVLLILLLVASMIIRP